MPTRTGGPGVGRALRKARLRQGLTLEEASRGTRLRAEYLRALEADAFDALPGDVYVRSFLRSYARFLGLSPERVVTAHERAHGGRRPTPAPVHRAPALAVSRDQQIPGGRRHFHWPLAAAVALVLFVAAAAVGLFSQSASTPEPARVAPGSGVPVLPEKVQVDLLARRDVRVVITADGIEKLDHTLREGEARSFEAAREITVWAESGGALRLDVNGTRVGAPGARMQPFTETYTRSDFRGDGSKDE